MKVKKKRIRSLEKEKMKSIEKAMKIGMDNFHSNVSYLLQELEQKNEGSSEYVILKSEDDILEEMDKLKKDIIFLSKRVNINFIIPILIKALDLLGIVFVSTLYRSYPADNGDPILGTIARSSTVKYFTVDDIFRNNGDRF